MEILLKFTIGVKNHFISRNVLTRKIGYDKINTIREESEEKKMEYAKLDAMQIGSRIKGLREKSGETMLDLSKSVGTSESAIGMYESGQRVPRDEIKIRIAEHFNVPVDAIFFPKAQHKTCEISA